jgi:hypothetical protein
MGRALRQQLQEDIDRITAQQSPLHSNVVRWAVLDCLRLTRSPAQEAQDVTEPSHIAGNVPSGEVHQLVTLMFLSQWYIPCWYACESQLRQGAQGLLGMP